MKSRLAMLLLGLAVSACTLRAQSTTYTLNKPFDCNAVGYYPVTSYAEFTCHSGNPTVQFLDANGNQATLYWWAGLERLYLNTPPFSTSNGKSTITAFTKPSDASGNHNCGYGYDPCTTPGTLSFDWSCTDTNGNPHNGTIQATWINIQAQGWFRPRLEPGSTITVLQ